VHVHALHDSKRSRRPPRGTPARAAGRDTFHFLEHGLSTDPRTARWQHRLDPWQQRLAGGCHLTRDSGVLVEESGMILQWLETGALPGFTGPSALTYGYLGAAEV
jgi:hypothetical protein